MKAKKNEKIQDLIIDKFYGEAKNENLDALFYSNTLFEKKLRTLKNKLEPMNKSSQVNIDIKKIIEDATKEKAKKLEKVNFLTFLSLSFLTFLFYVLLIYIKDFEFFVRLQILFGTLMPWILIPVSLISKRKGVRT